MLLRYAVEDYHKKLIYFVTFVLAAYSNIMFFVIVFQCVPISFYWTRATDYTNGRCMDPIWTFKATYGFNATFILFDVTMALLPWLMVRKLKLDLRTRLMVATILALGSV